MKSIHERRKDQETIFEYILFEQSKGLIPRGDGTFIESAKPYAEAGHAILDYHMDKRDMELPDRFFTMGQDISYLVDAYKDQGLIMAEPLWLGRVHGNGFNPSAYAKHNSLIQRCTDQELLFVMTAYQTGKANYFTDKFGEGVVLAEKFETSI